MNTLLSAKLFQYSSIVLICITKGYLTDYLRLNVIHDGAFGLLARISTTQRSKTVPELDLRSRDMIYF